MAGGAPSLTAEQKRSRRERDVSLGRERANRLREREVQRRRRLGVSLLTGPGGELGLGSLRRNPAEG